MAFGAAELVKGMKEFITGSIEGINTTRKFAEILGVSSEAMSKLQYAASLVDVDVDTLRNSLRSSISVWPKSPSKAKGPQLTR